jgi:hypothetical protein
MMRDENKGEWAELADEGVVPDALGEDRLTDKEPQLRGAVTGETTGDDSPATSTGVDLAAGDDADATRDGGPNPASDDLKDAGAAPRAVDR